MTGRQTNRKTHAPRPKWAKRDIPPTHPGEMLLEEFLKPIGISQAALARALRVPLTQVNSLIRGRRSVSGEMALRLGRYFGMDPVFWMNLQSHYDMEAAKDTLAGRLEREVTVYSEGS